MDNAREHDAKRLEARKMLVNRAREVPQRPVHYYYPGARAGRFVGQNRFTEPIQWQVDEIYKMTI